MLTSQEIEFIVGNATSDTSKLLLGAGKYPHINVKLCVNCIESRQKLISKLPQWYANTELVYPFPLSAEQCSSEATGSYKKEVLERHLNQVPHDLKPQNIIGADLTGGMGVDSWFLSQICHTHHYFERNAPLCEATEYNFNKLGAKNISVHNMEIDKGNISKLPGSPYSFIFIDPARRSKENKSTKVISLQDYEPNIVELKEELFKQAPTILAKVSPMADIKLNLKLLPETTEIHIVSVDNECKELLFMLERNKLGCAPSEENISGTPINAVNIKSHSGAECFSFTFGDEESARVEYACEVGGYLYEPNKSILKAGAFKSVAERYNLKKLAQSTHLYTADNLVEGFPGKIFKVYDTVEFNKKSIKKLANEYPQADITARNFPLDTNALKKMSGIKDGGNRHLFAVTLSNGKKVVIVSGALQDH